MAQQTTTSLFGKYAGEVLEAHREVVAREPELFGDLPPNINNGVARLIKCFISTITKEGDPNRGCKQFEMAAVAISPKIHDNVPVKGKQFRLNPVIPLYETPSWKTGGSFKEHYARMIDHLRILVGKDVWAQSGYFEGDSNAALEANLLRCMKDLEQKQPCFSFTTRPGRKQQIEKRGNTYWLGAKSYKSEEEAKQANPYLDRDPRTQVNWGDLLPDYKEDVASGFADATGNGQAAHDPHALTPDNEFDEQPSADDDVPTDEGDSVPASDEPPAASSDDDEVDLDALVAEAEDSEEARERLITIAGDYGIDRDTAEATESWAALKELIEEAVQNQGEPEPEPNEPTGPQVGDIVMYQPLDAKGNPAKGKDKKEIAPVKVKVLTVDTDKQTATLFNVGAKKGILNAAKKPLEVPWSHLQQAD